MSCIVLFNGQKIAHHDLCAVNIIIIKYHQLYGDTNVISLYHSGIQLFCNTILPIPLISYFGICYSVCPSINGYAGAVSFKVSTSQRTSNTVQN